jgi:DNA-binding response OmpR family regulator
VHNLPSVWIVDSDDHCQSLYTQVLGLDYELRVFPELAPFAAALRRAIVRPAFLIADLRLTDGSFMRLLRDAAAADLLRQIPFVVVTAYDDIDAMRRCFAAGARDYIIKPFGENEIRYKLSRYIEAPATEPAAAAAPAVEPARRGGPAFVLESTSLTVRAGSRAAAQLTSKEYQIMSLLERAPAHTLSRGELTSQVWNGIKVNEKALDVHIGNLRRKISPLGIAIKHVPPSRFALTAAAHEPDEA